MRIFDITENIKVVCDSADTRNGFKHIATLLINGNEILNTKICYINRTWESYQYETIKNKILEIADKNKFIDLKSIKIEEKI